MHILVTGTLHKPAVTRTSSNGNAYVTATIRTTQKSRDGETETLFASVIAFRDEARDTLARLNPGDAVSIGGACTVGIWERDNQYHPSLSIVAETVAAARPAQRRKEPETRDTRGSRGAPHATPDEPDFDDDIPF